MKKNVLFEPEMAAKPVIRKPAPLLSLMNSSLTLSEFKILDVFLARIDSHNPEQCCVRFSKDELETLLGVQKINLADLQEKIRHLSVMVQVDNPNLEIGFDLITLFERMACLQDEDGLWYVELQCTQDAMRYIFSIKNPGDVSYKLQTVACLRSRHSYLLFLYLESNRHRGTWEVSLEELRSHVGCVDSQAQYKYFNYNVLKPAKAELEEKADYLFTYEPIKRGRYVRSIRISLDPIPEF